MSERSDEVAGRLAVVRRRIASACDEAGRDPDGVTLVVVTKFFPESDVRVLADLGVRHVGENRHQEAEAKHAACSGLDLTWHFIGGLQSNKAAAVGAWADVVQSVDRVKLLRGLSRAAHDRDRVLDVCVQVSLDPPGESARAGVDPREAAALAQAVVEAEGLALRGVMAVAPRDADADEAFARLADVAAEVRAVDPSATWVSAGMSNDLEQAVRHGATHVRVGSAVLGNRPTHG